MRPDSPSGPLLPREPRVVLRLPGRPREFGRSMAYALRYVRPGHSHLQTCIRWDDLVAPHDELFVDRESWRLAIRRYFDGKSVVYMASKALLELRSSYRSDIHERLSEFALRDDWPATIDNSGEVLEYLARTNRRAIAVSEYGLLSIVVDALANPWGKATEPVSDEARCCRFLRLAMMASRLFDDRDDAEVAAADPYPAELLITVGRLREADSFVAMLVRAHALYVELLPSSYSEVFRQATGVGVTDWVREVCLLASTIEENVRGVPGRFPLFEPAVVGNPRRPVLRPIIELLAATPQSFQDEFAARRAATAPALGFAPLRKRPLLTEDGADGPRYIVLNNDFLLAAADDGVFYRIVEALPPGDKQAFFAALGDVVERYLRSSLGRLVGLVPRSAFAWVDGKDEDSHVKRCDFAWRVGDELVLLDAKRLLASSAILEGGQGLARRLDEQIGHACHQFVATAEHIVAHGVGTAPINIATELGVSPDWRPRRLTAMVVHHRALYVAYGTPDRVIASAGLDPRWAGRFSASPLCVSLADFDVLEACVEEGHVVAILDAVAAGLPQRFAGLPQFLDAAGFASPAASTYAQRRAEELLGQKLRPRAVNRSARKGSAVSSRRGNARSRP